MTKSLCDSSVCSKCRLHPSTVRCVGNGGLDKRRLSLLTVQINSTFLIKLQRLAGFMNTFQANYFHPAVGETFACLWMWHEGKLCWRLLGRRSAGICHHCRVLTLTLSKVSFSKGELCFQVYHDAILAPSSVKWILIDCISRWQTFQWKLLSHVVRWSRDSDVLAGKTAQWTESESDGSLFLLPATKVPQSLRNTDTASSFSLPRLLRAATLIPVNLNDVCSFPFNLFQRD